MTHALLAAAQHAVASYSPESANWSLVIIAFGVAGAILRRRRAAYAPLGSKGV